MFVEIVSASSLDSPLMKAMRWPSVAAAEGEPFQAEKIDHRQKEKTGGRVFGASMLTRSVVDRFLDHLKASRDRHSGHKGIEGPNRNKSIHHLPAENL